LAWWDFRDLVRHWVGEGQADPTQAGDAPQHAPPAESAPEPEATAEAPPTQATEPDPQPAVSEDAAAPEPMVEVAEPEPEPEQEAVLDVAAEDEAAGSDEPAGPERRMSPRVDKYGWARFVAGEIEGEGLVTNLSHGGALVERASEVLSHGTKFTLRLKLSGGFETLELDAEVEREGEDSFAFRFLQVDADTFALLSEAIGLASEREED
jgi:hypothetical protein